MFIITLLMLIQPSWAWEMSEVSVLLPLPRNMQEAPKLLSTTDRGDKGVLLPTSVVRDLPQLVFNVPKDRTFSRDMRVLGIRFDPCFTEGPGVNPCRRQIRLIWQPVVQDGRAVSTTDATLHTFYEFDEPSFKTLIDQYKNLLAQSPNPAQKRLGVNARVKAQGFDGVFYRGLKALILANCGEQNLVRATTMTLGRGENIWNFSGLNIQAGKGTPIQIVGINSTLQVLTTKRPAGFDLLAVAEPENFSRTAKAVYEDSLKAKRKLNESEFQNFTEDILNLENPTRHNPGTTDCASCHMTEPGAQWARLNFPRWDWAGMLSRSGFQSTRDLTNDTLVNLKPRRFRAFGYFGPDPLIAQRTINESAVVADAMDKSF